MAEFNFEADEVVEGASPLRGPSSSVAAPLPGFGPGGVNDDISPFSFDADPEVFDDTHSIFTMANQSLGRLGRGANVNIADLIDAPVDLINFILSGKAFPPPPEGQKGGEERIPRPEDDEPFIRPDAFRRFFEMLGIAPGPGEEDPPSIEKSAGKLTADVALLLLPFGRAAKSVTDVVRGVRTAPKTIAGRTVHQMAQHAIDNPKSFLAIEAAAGVTGGAAGFVVEQRFPNSPTVKVMAEMSGALTPGGIVGVSKLALTVVGAKAARNAILNLSAKGGQLRAEKRVAALARDPEAAKAELVADDALEGAALTSAQKTGDEGLLSLERAVIETSEQLKEQSDIQIAEATRVIREALAQSGEGVPVERTVETLQKAREYLTTLLDFRMKLAARKADAAIAELAPTATRRDANLIVEKEVEDALAAANKQLDDLFNDVPEEVKIGLKALKKRWAKRLEKTPLAQREDLPTIAARLLGKEKDEFDAQFAEAFATQPGLAVDDAAVGRLGDKASIKELQGLRSKLLEDARVARSAGKFNAARLASDTADDVLTTMGAQADKAGGPAGRQLRLALDFAADIKARFNRGFVRKLLRPDPQGGEFVPGALILETSVARGGPRARLETDELQRAVERTGDVPALRGAVEDFLLDDFERRVLRGGLTPEKAERFFARHRDVLEDFPELSARLRGATETRALARVASAKADSVARRLGDPKVSRAAVFLKEPAEDGIKRAANLPESEAGAIMAELVRETRRDTTGDALKGLKTAFGDFLLTKGSSAKTTREGEFLINGTVLKRLLEKPGPVKAMAENLFDEGELARLDIIIKTASKVEKAVKVKGRPEGIISDTQSILFSTLTGVAGAFVGRKLGTGTIQAPAFVANLFRRIGTKLTQDPARRLLLDAQQDEKLFEALLHPVGDIPASARRQINAWAAGILKEELTPEGELAPEGRVEDTRLEGGVEDTEVPVEGDVDFFPEEISGPAVEDEDIAEEEPSKFKKLVSGLKALIPKEIRP